MRSIWFRRTFVRLLEFLQVKEGWLNFLAKPILQKVWIIWSPLLYFNLKILKEPNSASFIRFQYMLDDSGVLFSDSWNFYKLKEGDLKESFWGNQFCKMSELFGSPFCISILKVLWTHPESLTLIRFECILYRSGVLFSAPWNSYKLKRGHLIWEGNQFCRKSKSFGPPSAFQF